MGARLRFLSWVTLPGSYTTRVEAARRDPDRGRLAKDLGQEPEVFIPPITHTQHGMSIDISKIGEERNYSPGCMEGKVARGVISLPTKHTLFNHCRIKLCNPISETNKALLSGPWKLSQLTNQKVTR